MLAEINGNLAGFMWFHARPYDDPDALVTFVPQPRRATVWDYDVFVDPAHRGGLVFFKLWTEASALLRSRGIEFTVSLVWSNNDDSIRSHQRLGAYPIGSAYQLRVGRHIIHIADRTPRWRWLGDTGTSPRYEFDARPTARKHYARFRKT